MYKQSRKFLGKHISIFNVNNLVMSSHRKETYFISWKKLYKKVSWTVKRKREKYKWRWKEKNVTINKRITEPSYHTTNFLTENLLAIEIRKPQILMNKPFYLGLSILDLSKSVMYELWYDDVKPKYGKNAKLCYMDTIYTAYTASLFK